MSDPPDTLVLAASGNQTVDPCLVSFSLGNVALMFIYSVLFVVAVGGNLLVCLVVLGQKRMRTITNFFLLNLAIADMAKALICIPFTFIINVLVPYWPFGPFMCPFVLYMQAVVVFLSAFTLVAMSIDRYMAILYPLRQRLSMRNMIVIIAVVWFMALIVPLPTVIKSHVINPFVNKTDECQKGLCIEDIGSEELRRTYTMVIMGLQYFVPLAVLTYTYTRIGFVIWIKRTPGEVDRRRDARIASSKRKMVKMMIVVVIIYALCWLPLHAVQLVTEGNEAIYDFSYYQFVWMAAHWLAMSYACYNPIVYFWMNKRFRVGFKGLLFFCRHCKSSIGHSVSNGRRPNNPLHRSNSHSSSRYSPRNSMDESYTKIVKMSFLQKSEDM